MDRRSVLALAGVTLTPGCGDIVSELAPGTANGTADGTTVPGPATEASPTPSPTANETQETPATETQTPHTPRPEAAQLLEAARDHLETAYDAYVGFADTDGATLLDVTAATSVSSPPVTNAVRKATAKLDQIPEGAYEETERTAAGLRAVGTLLAAGSEAQRHLNDAHESVTFVTGRLWAEQLSAVSGSVDELESASAAATAAIDRIESETTAADVAVFAALGGDAYDRKLEQFRSERDTFELLVSVLRGLERALEAFGSGVRSYDGEHFVTAKRSFETVDAEVGPSAETLSGLDAPASIAATVADLESVADALAAAAPDLTDAAEAGSRGRAADRRAAFDRAAEHLRSSTIATEQIESVQRLLR